MFIYALLNRSMFYLILAVNYGIVNIYRYFRYHNEK